MAIEVRIPTILRTYTGGEKAVEGSGTTLSELIDDLESNHPGIKDRLVEAKDGRRAAPLRQRLRQRRGRALHRRPGDRSSPTATRSSCCRPSPAAEPDDRRDPLRQPPRLRRRHPARRAAEALAVARRTPLGQARGPQPDRLDQGPPGAADDRAGREGRHAAPGLHDPRAHERQHRHLAGDGRQAQGLPAGLRDAGEHLRGAPPAAADVGRRDRLLARGGRLQRGRAVARRRSPRSTPTG